MTERTMQERARGLRLQAEQYISDHKLPGLCRRLIIDLMEALEEVAAAARDDGKRGDAAMRNVEESSPHWQLATCRDCGLRFLLRDANGELVTDCPRCAQQAKPVGAR